MKKSLDEIIDEVMGKSYDPPKFRRKIPKVGRSYKRHREEKKTFDKSKPQDINDLVEELMNKSDIVDEILQDEELMEKAKYKSRKRVGGKWVYDYGKKQDVRPAKKEPTVDEFMRDFFSKPESERPPRIAPKEQKPLSETQVDSKISKIVKRFSGGSITGMARMRDFVETLSKEEQGQIVSEMRKRGYGAIASHVNAIPLSKSQTEDQYMSKIDQEIEELAELMEKSSVDPETDTMATMSQLTKEEFRELVSELEPEQAELLKSILSKAVSMDDSYEGDRKFITSDKMGIEEEDGSDDEDEKLVKPEAAKHNHQGDRTPEGIDDHVIKGMCKSCNKAECMCGESKVDSTGAEILSKKAPKGVDPEKHESCVKDVKKQGKSVGSAHAICTASMKKSVDEIDVMISEGEELYKSLFAEKNVLSVSGENKENPSKDDIFQDLKWKIDEMKRLKDMRWIIEDELPEAKDAFEAKWGALKRDAKAILKKYSSMKKSMDQVDSIIDDVLGPEFSDSEDLEKAKTVTRGGQQYYAEGPHAGKLVGSVRGKGGASLKAIARARAKGKISTQGAKAGSKKVKEQAKHADIYRKVVSDRGSSTGSDLLSVKRRAARKLADRKAGLESKEYKKRLEQRQRDFTEGMEGHKDRKATAEAGRKKFKELKAKQDKRGKDMKKSQEQIMEEIELTKSAVIETFEEEGIEYDTEMVKGMVKELLLENSEEEEAAGAEEPQSVDEPIQKSITWGDPQAKLRANTMGRNHHFNVNAYYDYILEKSKTQEPSKEKAEALEKSKKSDVTICDLIEKGLDASMSDLRDYSTFKAQERGNFSKSSFNDSELAESMGMTEEEVKKILGE